MSKIIHLYQAKTDLIFMDLRCFWVSFGDPHNVVTVQDASGNSTIRLTAG